MPLVYGSPLPSASQELLLKAALFDGQPMLDAWHEWRRKVDFEKEVEYSSQRLLPLLYQNLHQHKINDPVLQRMKGMYRKSWSKNHILFQQAGMVLEKLAGAGVPTLVLKGIPLTLNVYKNYATRPMSDMDIMVPYIQAERSINLLLNDGWSLQRPHRLEFYMKYGRSVGFVNADNTELDLHWHPVYEMHEEITESDFWDRAVPIEVSGVKSLALCAADTLFHAVVHGLRYNDEPPVRWVPDAVLLIRQKDHPVDWDRLMEYTRHFRVFIQMGMALNYLRQTFNAEIPESVLKELAAIRPGRADKLVFWHAMNIGDRLPENFKEKMLTIYVRYIRQTNNKGFFQAHLGLIKYLFLLAKGKSLRRLLRDNISLLFKQRRKS